MSNLTGNRKVFKCKQGSDGHGNTRSILSKRNGFQSAAASIVTERSETPTKTEGHIVTTVEGKSLHTRQCTAATVRDGKKAALQFSKLFHEMRDYPGAASKETC